MSRVQQLYQLQSLDSELDQTRQKLAEVTASLGESAALKTARRTAEEAEKKLRKSQAVMQDLDLEVKGLVEKIARQEKALYGGRAISAKEATNLQEEVVSLKRWHEKREESLLEAMVAVEEAEIDRDQAQAELASIKSSWAADQEQLKQTQSELQTKAAQLTEQRPTIAGAIAPEDLKRYESLRQRMAGRAVAPVKNGTCQGCGIDAPHSQVQKARSGAELVFCSTCGRILYVV